MGGYAIVGGHIPLAAGSAFATKYQKLDLVTLCFFGEGAVPSGQAHEAFNLAALWKLPVIFICENNRYGMGTPVERAVALYENVAEAARSYGIKAERVDGMDVLGGPFVDAHRGGASTRRPGTLFYRGDDLSLYGPLDGRPSHGHYRTKGEVEEHRQRDPLLLLKQTILTKKLVVKPISNKWSRR